MTSSVVWGPNNFNLGVAFGNNGAYFFDSIVRHEHSVGLGRKIHIWIGEQHTMQKKFRSRGFFDIGENATISS